MKNIWRHIKLFFSKVFSGAIAHVNKYVKPSIEAVQLLKSFTESPVLPLLNALIPSQLDDVITAKLKEALPKILAGLELADKCAKQPSNDEIIQCVIAQLKTFSPDVRKQYWLSVASRLSMYLSDGKLTWAEAIMLVQYTYQERYNK